MKGNRKEVKSLYDLYHQLDVGRDVLSNADIFTILNLSDVGFDLPYQSEPFRPDYFSFLFVKEGKGAYTIDEQSFHVEAQSIYFTNPSHYRTFG